MAEGDLSFVRACFDGSVGEPWMSLYEVTPQGHVLRHLHMHEGGIRFAPEDVLMVRSVDKGVMLEHPAAETITRDTFEALWREFWNHRDFVSRVPDPDEAWLGQLTVGGMNVSVRWQPNGKLDGVWSRVDGFERLFVDCAEHIARVRSAVFLNTPIEWTALPSHPRASLGSSVKDEAANSLNESVYRSDDGRT